MNMRSWIIGRPARLLSTLALLLGSLNLMVAPALAAEPVPDCTTSDGISSCTVTFEYSGAPATWKVPAGVTTATFEKRRAVRGGQRADATNGRDGTVGRTRRWALVALCAV
jgi:hypothetical protein